MLVSRSLWIWILGLTVNHWRTFEQVHLQLKSALYLDFIIDKYRNRKYYSDRTILQDTLSHVTGGCSKYFWSILQDVPNDLESHLHFIALHFKLSQYFGFVLDTPLCPKDITESLPTFRLGQDVLYIKWACHFIEGKMQFFQTDMTDLDGATILGDAPVIMSLPRLLI